MYSPKVKVLSGPPSLGIVRRALGMCTNKAVSSQALDNIWRAGHESPFEHVVFTFHLKDVSRNCAMQIIRHRSASYTMASQHYVEQGSQFITGWEPGYEPEALAEALAEAYEAYQSLLASGVNKEEARQVLPGCMATQLIVTMNLRTLIHFIVQRRCRRNVPEMVQVANCIRDAVILYLTSSTDILFFQAATLLECVFGQCRQPSYMRCKGNGNSVL